MPIIIGSAATGGSYSVTPRLKYKPVLKPKDGYDGQVVIRPDRIEIDKNGNVASRGSLVFHELQESYETIDNHKPYVYQEPKYLSRGPCKNGLRCTWYIN